MDIRVMDEESVVFNFAGENSTARCSPLINTIKYSIIGSNGFSVNGSAGDIVDGGSYRHILRNWFIVVIDSKSGITELQKLSRVIFCPSLTLSGSNFLSSEFSSHSHSAAALLLSLPRMGDSNKLSGGPSAVMVTFREAA